MMMMMTPKTGSKKTSAAASKIKNKILNTSSFFKVSLKTNNKALALALETQKERSRLLQKEVTYFQKQAEDLCFELAAMKYKKRKLLFIVENLRSNTLRHLDMIAGLFSDSEIQKIPEDGVGNADPVIGSLTDQLSTQPEISEPLFHPIQTTSGDTPEEIIFSIPEGWKNHTTSSGKTDDREMQCVQSPKTGSHPPINLRHEAERLSMVSQPGIHMDPVLCPWSAQAPPAVTSCEHPGPEDAPLPNSPVTSTEQEHSHKQEKTVLLNTTMEMTQVDVTEIITVETKAKKTGYTGKPKIKKKKKNEQSGEASQAMIFLDSKLGGVQHGPSDVVCTDDKRVTDVVETESSTSECTGSIPTRIPKLVKSVAGNHKKGSEVKSHDQDKSKSKSCNTGSSDLDDYFMHHKSASSKDTESVLLPEEDTEVGARSKITCRRTRTKGRSLSSTTRKAFTIFPLQVNEGSQPEMEEQHTSVEPESSMKTNTGASHGCRLTFNLSNSEAEEPQTVLDVRINQSIDALDSEGHRDDYRSNSNMEICLPDKGRASGAEYQKIEEAKKEGKRQSKKRKVVQREEVVGQLNDRKKKKKSSKGFTSENEPSYPGFDRDEHLEMFDPHSNGSGRDGDISEHHYDFRSSESNSGRGQNPKQPGNSSPKKLLDFTVAGPQRETFVIYQSKSQESGSRKKRTTVLLNAYGDMIDASKEVNIKNTGQLLTDEMPPWLDGDVSSADREVGWLLATPQTEASVREAATETLSPVATKDSPAGSALTSLTNTIATPDRENRGRTRRRNALVSYKEPALNSKMRRGDKHSETTFLNSPVFKEGKKKRPKKTAPHPKPESSALMD